jgi:hypothetical protein
MRKISLAFLLLIICASVCLAQSAGKVGSEKQAAQSSTTTAPQQNLNYNFGKSTVNIPAPDGFAEAASEVEHVKRTFEMTEAPALDFLASHVPVEEYARLKRGEFVVPTFYTKVSTLKNQREVNVSAEEFTAIANYLHANNSKLFDIDGPAMKSSLKNTNKGLSELLETEAKLDLSQPVNLGLIQRTENSYGNLMMTKYKIQAGNEQKEALILFSVNLIRVKQRIIYLYVYRRFDAEADIDIIRNLTKQWINKILNANLN